jgi:hypothetical protein
MAEIAIIASLGNVSGLNLSDVEKRRFVRLGAPEHNPEILQGTIHLPGIELVQDEEASGLAQDVFWALGLNLFTLNKSWAVAKALDPTFAPVAGYHAFFITGVILYKCGDCEYGVLASVRQIDWDEDNSPTDPDFRQQYLDPEAEEGASSVAAELDGAWVLETEKAYGPAAWGLDAHVSDRDDVARILELHARIGSLSIGEKGEYDRLRNKYRGLAGVFGPAQDEPQSYDSRLS